MNSPLLTFADMIAPVASSAFFAGSWEEEPLHIQRADQDFYAQLLTRHDIDAAINNGGLRFPAIQLAMGGSFLAPGAFTKTLRSGEDLFTGVPNLDQVAAAYQAGATISLPGFHRAWQPLGTLAASIEDEFSHATHTNVYLTPGHAAGFTPHFDGHDVFILQIAGKKHWKIYNPLLKLPHRSQNFDVRHVAASAPLLELDLIPGDLLYLPRGYVHTTTTSGSASAHVTVGVTVYTWVELVAELIQSSRNSHACRRALPMGFANDLNASRELKNRLLQVISDLQQDTDYDALIGSFTQRIKSARSAQPGEFRSDRLAVQAARAVNVPGARR